jgi:hypothetical protein
MLLFTLFNINVYFFMLQLCVLNMRFKGKRTSMCRDKHTKFFQVMPLELAHVLFDDPIFRIMSIARVTRMPTTMREHCEKNKGVEPTPFHDMTLHDFITRY